jgi:hypothetical protein
VLPVDVIHEERDLALRPRRRIRGRTVTNQPGQLAAREQRELRTLRCELRVGGSAEAQRHSDDIAVEADRSVEIAEAQDRVAKTGRHASMFAPAAASNALSDELVAAPGHRQSNQKLVTVPHLNGRQTRLTLATLPRPQRDVEELARHRLQCCSGEPEKLRSPLGPPTQSCREPRRHRRDRARAGTWGRTSGAGLSRTTALASGSSSASSGAHHAPSSSRVAVSPAPSWMRLVPVRKHKPLSIGPRVLPVI